jgi:hypothetical protein
MIADGAGNWLNVNNEALHYLIHRVGGVRLSQRGPMIGLRRKIEIVMGGGQ